jgi:alanyl-tRNA synthetase
VSHAERDADKKHARAVCDAFAQGMAQIKTALQTMLAAGLEQAGTLDSPERRRIALRNLHKRTLDKVESLEALVWPSMQARWTHLDRAKPRTDTVRSKARLMDKALEEMFEAVRVLHLSTTIAVARRENDDIEGN